MAPKTSTSADTRRSTEKANISKDKNADVESKRVAVEEQGDIDQREEPIEKETTKEADKGDEEPVVLKKIVELEQSEGAR